MRLVNKIVALILLPVFLVSTPAFAQQPRVVDAATMSQALAGKAHSEQAQRALVRRVLVRGNVQEMAARMGLSPERADAAVTTLSGAELTVLADHASTIEAQALAGGANTIVISTTTLLLILIVVILVAK